MLNLARNVGASFGISAIVAMFARNTQISQSDIAANVTSFNVPAIDAASTAERMGGVGEMGLVILNGEATRQAAMIAYLDSFY